MQNTISYEQPLNERIRTFLRLEFLFKQLGSRITGTDRWDTRSTVSSLLEIQSITDRGDLRTEIIKELERHTTFLAQLEQNPAVDRRVLDGILTEIENLVDTFHELAGPIASNFKKHEFLNTVMQRSGIAGGACDFDLPCLHYWLEKPVQQRNKDLTKWINTLEPVHNAMDVILRTIRESAGHSEEKAENGIFQKQLDKKTPVQLVRITLARTSPCFPEISASKHRVSVRFLEQMNLSERPQQVNDDVPFLLSCCGI